MKLVRFSIMTSSLSVAGLANASPKAPEVATSSDVVSGVVVRGTRAFLGIPYVAAPVGELRWRPPIDAKPWTGLKETTKFGPSCFQQSSPGRENWAPFTSEFAISGAGVSEDCLSLNVRMLGTGKRGLPVLVWIHGGGFGGGSDATPIFDGSRLAAEGAVIFTIDYRVGPFGFLAHPQLSAESSDKVSGNYGLLDMMAALRWVRSNARRFGGDPSRVTVAGQSAGAMSINTLLESPEDGSRRNACLCLQFRPRLSGSGSSAIWLVPYSGSALRVWGP